MVLFEKKKRKMMIFKFESLIVLDNPIGLVVLTH
jgi:hypothetical protein